MTLTWLSTKGSARGVQITEHIGRYIDSGDGVGRARDQRCTGVHKRKTIQLITRGGIIRDGDDLEGDEK